MARKQKQNGFRFSLPWVASSKVSPQSTPPQAQVVEPQKPPARRPLATTQNPNTQQSSPPRAQESKDINTRKTSPSSSRINSQSLNATETSSPSQSSSRSQTPTHSPSSKLLKSPSISRPPTPKTISKHQSPPTLAPKSDMELSNQASTSRTPSTNKRNIREYKPKVEENEENEKQSLDIRSEETTKGKDIMQEPSLSENNSASEEEPKPVVEEEIVSIKGTLNPTSSTQENAKTIITDFTDKNKNTKYSGSSPMHKGIKDDISKFVNKITNERQKLPSEENQISVITLTGENRGAIMTLGHESGQRDGKINIRRGYKVNPHESIDSATEGEKSSDEKAKNSKSEEDEDPTAYINSNIQSINNSIMFNSSITDGNPGVHFTVSSNAVMESVDESKGRETNEDQKTKFNVAKSQKSSDSDPDKPVVRRRCLKGLFTESSDSDPDNPDKPVVRRRCLKFTESSDSDPDNPDKPRRHGCRYVCAEKSGEDLL